MLYTSQEISKRKNIEIKTKKIWNFIIYFILIIIMTYNISLIFQSILNPNKTPSFLGIKTYVIISGSMEPNINIGDIVITKESDEELQIGDVISYRKGQSVITHRITNIIKEENGDTKYRTKGDNNNTEDSEEILIENIEGKVIKVVPKLGEITLLLQNKISIIIIFIILYIYISSNYKKNKKINSRHLKRMEYEKTKNRLR